MTFIHSYIEELKTNGAADTTISSRARKLSQIAKMADLTKPEEIKLLISQQKWNTSTKATFTQVYGGLINYLAEKYSLPIQWKPPKYTKQRRLPFIPTETEIDQLIASCHSKHMIALLQTLKETGMRIGEALLLTWVNLDYERKTVNITPEKGSNPRILPISDRLIAMLKFLDTSRSKPFYRKDSAYRTSYTKTRKLAAKNLNNPRIKQIAFHTFRHWKATIEYHNTKDVIHVKNLLGHRDIECTMIYINLEQATFLSDNDHWISRVAHNETEECQLIEAGFEHVANRGDLHFYRKRK